MKKSLPLVPFQTSARRSVCLTPCALWSRPALAAPATPSSATAATSRSADRTDAPTPTTACGAKPSASAGRRCPSSTRGPVVSERANLHPSSSSPSFSSSSSLVFHFYFYCLFLRPLLLLPASSSSPFSSPPPISSLPFSPPPSSSSYICFLSTFCSFFPSLINFFVFPNLFLSPPLLILLR